MTDEERVACKTMMIAVMDAYKELTRFHRDYPQLAAILRTYERGVRVMKVHDELALGLEEAGYYK